jgi:anti-anti-sigma factor
MSRTACCACTARVVAERAAIASLRPDRQRRDRATVSAVLDVEITGRGTHRVLVLSGQMDLDNASQLDLALEAVCADGAREVVLNLQGLDFMDTTGLGTVLAGRTLCQQHGCRYFIERPVPPSLKRLFAVAGAHHHLPFKRRARQAPLRDGAP